MENRNARRPMLPILAGILLLLLFFGQGPLLRRPLDPALGSYATLRALVPPFLYDLAVALCLALCGAVDLPRRRRLDDLAPFLLYLLLLPLGQVPLLGGAYGGTAEAAAPRLTLPPLFGALGMLSLLRFAHALIKGKGRCSFSPRGFAIQLSLAVCVLCLPALTVSLKLGFYVRLLTYPCLALTAMTLLPYARPSLSGGCALLIAGALPALLAVLAFHTTLMQGTTLRSLCALCLTPAALPLYASVLLLGAYSLYRCAKRRRA